MTLIGAIPIQIPVHRIRVRAKCLAMGGPVHAAVLRLADLWGGDSPEEIAEVLGLRIDRVQKLLNDLEQGGEEIEREFVLWVDHARGRCLPHDALTGVAVKRSKSEPLSVPADHPTPPMLERMGLEAGLSWDLGIEGHAQVLDVLDVGVDIRDRKLPYELRLPDTQLVITHTDTADDQPWEFSVTQYGIEEPLLTHWVREHHTDHIRRVLNEAQLDPAKTPPQQLTQLTSRHTWDEHAPHPELMRGHITEAAEDAEQRVVLCAPDLRSLPMWLEEALRDASERDVEVVLCPSQADFVPSKPDFEFTVSASTYQPGALALITDEHQALLHSDPAGSLKERPTPVRQYLYSTTGLGAIRELLERLRAKRLGRRPPRRALSAEDIRTRLERELQRLRPELPQAVQPHIQPADVPFAAETLERYATGPNAAKGIHTAIAGVAWERALAEQVNHLSQTHNQIRCVAERWCPTGKGMDLDLVIQDTQKGVVWIIDAKNARESDKQLFDMTRQIRLLRAKPDLMGRCPTIIGLIVHRKDQIRGAIQPTEYAGILRCSPHGLHQLLVSKTLPGERHQPQGRPKAA
jgi:hypothetical protein